jgi:ribosomal protein L11 methyltransferase
MYMVRVAGVLEDWGEWPIDGAEERPGETWVYFSSQLVARSFARAVSGKMERARWEVNLAYQQQWTAKPVGKLWWIAPDWDEAATPPDRMRLKMNPGLVFGAGDHETTCGCLEMMELLNFRGKSVFDLGTGTGILSEAASRLGASLVVACDLEEDAARMAHERGVVAFQGPSFALPDHRFDVLLVNVPGYVHLDLAPEYTRLLRPEGQLVLSGYYDWQAERIEASLPQFDKLHQISRGDAWVASIFSHARATASSDRINSPS